nr:MAG TPA: hypothetical protein [Caudoviricetes sp.]
MAEYKYRALGWQDDDIASLNVVDGTAADNQVELQITKQGEGGTINGPAIIGKDGITIDKAADSEKIEISGSGCVQQSTEDISLVYGRTNNTEITIRYSGWPVGNSIPLRFGDGRLQAVAPTEDLDCTNKKYVDDNYVAKDTTSGSFQRAYIVDADGSQNKTLPISYSNQAAAQSLPRRDSYGAIYIPDSSIGKTDYNFAAGQEAVNKKYVDDAVAAGSATVDGTSIVKDTDGKIQLNQEYIDYLDNQLYQPPAISVFTMLDAAGAALPTSNELGTTLSAAAFNHQETNIKNIQGDNVELHINNAAAATTSTAKKDVATKVTLTTAQSITNSTKFTLKGTNTRGAAFSRDYQVNFYRYAYTATTDATTAPTSGATQQAAVSTFASNGSTFDYTKGGYIYFYTDNTGKKVQTNVLGQWADVDTTDMGKVTLTQSNGATHEYTCYRIGPFIETGSAKYRV